MAGPEPWPLLPAADDISFHSLLAAVPHNSPQSTDVQTTSTSNGGSVASSSSGSSPRFSHAFLARTASPPTIDPTTLTSPANSAQNEYQNQVAAAARSIFFFPPSPPSPPQPSLSPDSHLLALPHMTLLRASLAVAARLGCTGNIFSLACRSPFNDASTSSFPSSPSATLLPPAWRPTPSQLLVPHHPLVDLLPWPSARDRLLDTLSLPAHMLPTVGAAATAATAGSSPAYPEYHDPTAADAAAAAADGDGNGNKGEHGAATMAMVHFAYDLEDDAEGMRVSGPDPCDAARWEVGQLVFERWWFIFDRAIVEQSNRLRRMRGAPPLRMPAMGSVTEMG